MADEAPSKASLVRWWKAFTRKEKERAVVASSSSSAAAAPPPPQRTAAPLYSPQQRGLEPGQSGKGRVFGVALAESLQYASVAISLVADDGNQYVYGYVPIVVAKCGMMLKETATHTEGIFRVSGSNKRINQLQAVFDAPPKYGKDFDWTGYSVHDAASVLRRYLNALPEPVIPAGLYLDFTAVLQKQQPTAASIAEYRHLISLLPPASRYLLLYLLDFLSVFARCSDQNKMTASNLAVVFQPGLVSSRGGGQNALLGFPGFDGRPTPATSAGASLDAQEQAGQHSRDMLVLSFLLEHQTSFMLDLEAPVDAERQKRKGVEVPLAARGGRAVAGQRTAAVVPGGPAPRHAAPPPPVGEALAPQSGARADEPVASTSALPAAAAAAAAGAGHGGATDFHRRGSEKSVERRRLRKGKDETEGGKVKRSKTWGSATRRKRAEGREPSPSPNDTSSNNSPRVSTAPAFAPQKSSSSRADVPTIVPAPESTSLLGHRPSVKKKARKSGASDKSPLLASGPLPPPPGLSPSSAAAPMARTASSGSSKTPIPPASSGGGGSAAGDAGKPRRRSMDPDGRQ
ncbi:hypothetical protein JCM3775_005290 [Rhodotorula graminis]